MSKCDDKHNSPIRCDGRAAKRCYCETHYQERINKAVQDERGARRCSVEGCLDTSAFLFCNSHYKCQTEGCLSPAAVEDRCFEHTPCQAKPSGHDCGNFVSKDVAQKGAQYCQDHTCTCTWCINEVVRQGHCTIHSCIFDKCSQQALPEDSSHCEYHSCRFTSCRKEVTQDNANYCATHTCKTADCMEGINRVGVTLCAHHIKCKDCNEDKTQNSADYCLIHVHCEYCSNFRHLDSRYCTQHMCWERDCSDSASDGLGYCRKHICQRPLKGCSFARHRKIIGSSVESSNFCPIHTCEIRGCLKEAREKGENQKEDYKQLGYCADHRCMEGNCQAIRSTEQSDGAPNSPYCEEHTCRYRRCVNFNKEMAHCPDHKCKDNKCKNEQISTQRTFCSEHACKTMTCSKHNNGRVYCEEERCVDEFCTKARLVDPDLDMENGPRYCTTHMREDIRKSVGEEIRKKAEVEWKRAEREREEREQEEWEKAQTGKAELEKVNGRDKIE